MFRMTSRVAYLAVLIITLAISTRISSRTMDSAEFNSVQNPLIVAPNFPTMIKSIQDNLDHSVDRLCQLEYQVTRKRIGKCVKLGRGMTGCISGEYMNPLHPDCF